MLKSVLIFLIGVMVGANIVYFVMTRDGDRAGRAGPAGDDENANRR